MSNYSMVSRDSSERNDYSGDDEKPMLPQHLDDDSDEETPIIATKIFNAKQFALGALLGSLLSVCLLLAFLAAIWHTKIDKLCLARESYFCKNDLNHSTDQG